MTPRPADPASPAEARHPALSADDVLAGGGWSPRYARVLLVATDGDRGLALVDGNGDGWELEVEIWAWCEQHGWEAAGTSMGAGALARVGNGRTGGRIDDLCFAYGRLPGRTSATLQFRGHACEVPVNQHGYWGFVSVDDGSAEPDEPRLIGWA
jgi:hypothetical protein